MWFGGSVVANFCVYKDLTQTRHYLCKLAILLKMSLVSSISEGILGPGLLPLLIYWLEVSVAIPMDGNWPRSLFRVEVRDPCS